MKINLPRFFLFTFFLRGITIVSFPRRMETAFEWKLRRKMVGILIVARNRVFEALEDCPLHFVFGNREVVVINRGGEVDWSSFFRSHTYH